MLMHTLSNVSQLTAVAADGRWLGQDYVLALLAATFPAWTLVTLVRGWFRRAAAAIPVQSR